MKRSGIAVLTAAALAVAATSFAGPPLNGTYQSTDLGDTFPPGYPPLLEQGTCDPSAPLGTWWNMYTLTMTIKGCTVPVEETSWGAVKSMYSE